MYAFDVHCNSYFPLFLILYGVQQRRFFSPLEFISPRPPVPRTQPARARHVNPALPRVPRPAQPSPPAVLQYFLCPVLLQKSFIATVLSNSLYGIAMSYYHYTQFLGYSGASDRLLEQRGEAKSCAESLADVHCISSLTLGSLLCRFNHAALPFLDRTEFFLYPIAGARDVMAAVLTESVRREFGVRACWP